ncbi:MAG: ArnT family glycosyltransferase [Chloroflexota bacterium]
MKNRFFTENTGLVFLAVLKLAIQLANSAGYGYFVDELYYLALVRHLDFGYVDVPPVVPLLMAVSNHALGTSLFAMHLFPALAGAVMVFFAGLLAREMGGGRFAQYLTAVAVIFAPIWLVLNSWFAYDAFDQLATVILIYVSLRVAKAATPQRWIVFGIVAGVGMMTKLTMLMTCAALGLAWLPTPQRKSLVTRWPWAAAGVATLVCLPFALWQYNHGWPLLTYWQHYAQFRPHPGIFQFFTGLVLALHPLTLPIWLSGLFFLCCHPTGRRYRFLGWMYIILLVLYTMVMRTEYRMLVSACVPLLAAGAVQLESTFATARRQALAQALAWGYVVALCASGLFFIPETLPGAAPTQADQTQPDHVALRIGWPEMTEQVAAIYHSLPECTLGHCAIYTSYYGEAAAIDFFGEAYGLPKAVSNHLTYQVWGPGQQRHDAIIAFGKRFSVQETAQGTIPLGKICEEVTLAGTVTGQPGSIAYEKGLPVYVCKRPLVSLQEIWEALEFYY